MSAPERLMLAAMIGLLLGGGVMLAVVAFAPPRHRRSMKRFQTTVSSTTVAVAVGVGVIVLVVTRWPIAAVAAIVLVLTWSTLFQSAAATSERRRVDAIAKWLEDLRDLQRGSNLDLPQALERSASRAPKEISGSLGRFVDRTHHHMPLDEALLELAADIDHPTCDMAVASMLFAYGHASGSALHDTFSELARSTRDEVTARDQIDRIRTRFESSMRNMVIILCALIGYMLVLSPDTLAEYGSPAGQAFLVLPLAVWGLALWWLSSLSRYRRAARYLDYRSVAERAGASA